MCRRHCAGGAGGGQHQPRPAAVCHRPVQVHGACWGGAHTTGCCLLLSSACRQMSLPSDYAHACAATATPCHPLSLTSPVLLFSLCANPLGCRSQVFPDYKERVVRHEAAHFLTGAGRAAPCAAPPAALVVPRRAAQRRPRSFKRGLCPADLPATPCSVPAGYLLGVPVANYSLTLGKEHTDFAGEPEGWDLGAGSLGPDLRAGHISAASRCPPPASLAAPGHPAEGLFVLCARPLRAEAKLQKRLIEGTLAPEQVGAAMCLPASCLPSPAVNTCPGCLQVL